MRKDISLALKEIDKLKLSLPLSEELLDVYDMAEDKNEDFSATVKVIERMNGFILKP